MLAEEIIRKYHPALEEFSIAFVFRSEASTAGGRTVLGQAAKVPAKLAPFMDHDAIIWLAKDMWHTLNTIQKRALIDHELCHLSVGTDGSLQVVGHDIEEFKVIVERYGLWKSDLRDIAPAFVDATQLTLPEFETPRKQGGVMALEPELAEAAL